ncbi:hypothetical protein CEUSTIGMA_g10976.t1 [Chlamydomonas eustigma]|uniref:RRM domain-containing protein n=1 Tax=Chlamydomonas eustigma TaxID=1157962 RepID=A0A250XKD4_9CHLO|nr:hypothetical protein CEUSTIGMA_g10976.t1 [Chlamydomonas eustigma]|eukprot:GAX83551.1 hypothetical protein CEUSTIGMA_g10976.t1 [Chlamydomonas eustigma]
MGSAVIIRWGSAVIIRWGSAVVIRWGSAVIIRWGSAVVIRWGSAVIIRWGSAVVIGWGSAVVIRWGSAVVIRWGSAVVIRWGSAVVIGWGSAVIIRWGSAGPSLRCVGLGFVGGLNNLQTTSPMSPNNLINSPSTSRQRLFVVVHKGVSEDLLQRLFRRLPGMEYCDLKKDRTTGRSKGFCYINYSTQEAAAAAIEQFNGVEFPPQSGHRIKVMFAEPLGTSQQRSANGQRSGSSEADTGRSSPAISMLTMSSPSPVHTPLVLGMGGDVVQGVQESLATMSSVQRQAAVAAAAAAAVAHNGARDQMELAARIAASPGQQNGTLNSIVLSTPAPARELMFNGMSSS